MVVIYGLVGLLAIRHVSKLIAALGLLGGFATPLLLSSGADRPFGLFAYMGPERSVLGVYILAMFAILYVFVAPSSTPGGVRQTQFSALLISFAFALYRSSYSDFGPHLLPLTLCHPVAYHLAACLLARGVCRTTSGAV